MSGKRIFLGSLKELNQIWLFCRINRGENPLEMSTEKLASWRVNRGVSPLDKQNQPKKNSLPLPAWRFSSA